MTPLLLLLLLFLSPSVFGSLCDLDSPDVVGSLTRLGLNVTQQQVTSMDGVSVMTLFRVKSPSATASNRVVLLQHGLFDSAYTWAAAGSSSLTLALAARGDDVWLANSRGNWFAPVDNWDWDWDDMRADFAASVARVLKVTGRSKIDVVSHSQGSAVVIGALSTMGSLATAINRVVALAPPLQTVYAASNIMSTLAFTHADVALSALSKMDCALQVMGAAIGTPLGPLVLEDLFGTTASPNTYLDGRYINFFPAPTSGRTVAHWVKNFRWTTFSDFSKQPYPVGNIPSFVTITAVTGGADHLATPEDLQAFTALVARRVVVPTFAHMDFTWSPQQTTLLHPIIFAALS